jgi:hypothetical protein
MRFNIERILRAFLPLFRTSSNTQQNTTTHQIVPQVIQLLVRISARTQSTDFLRVLSTSWQTQGWCLFMALATCFHIFSNSFFTNNLTILTESLRNWQCYYLYITINYFLTTWPFKMVPMLSRNNCHPRPRNVPEGGRPHIQHGGSQKSRKPYMNCTSLFQNKSWTRNISRWACSQTIRYRE